MGSTEWAQAARVARSTGFGGQGVRVDAIAAAGVEVWLARQLSAPASADPGVAATPPPKVAAPSPLAAGASRDLRRQRNQQVREQLADLTTWWLRRMVTVQEPFVERLTFGWHNHFATSATKVRSAQAMLAQNERLRALGRGSFTALAQAMVVDPALVWWLDGQKNTAKAPNENLSREFMELFALGRGDHGSTTGTTSAPTYTEQDVREGARALTGWTLDRVTGDLRRVPRRHDTGSKTFLGTTGDLDAEGFVNTVLAQPDSAAFVASRWWRQVASPQGPARATLDRMVAAYGDSRDLAALFQTMLTDPAYVAAAGSLVASPVEWVVGSMRALQVPSDDGTLNKALGALRALGQVPFAPPNVSGWPSGQAWLSTASAATRVEVAQMLAKASDLGAVQDAVPAARVEATRHLLGIPTFTQRTAAALAAHTGDPQQLVALALVSPENLVT